MSKLKVAVIYGGCSGEHEVSCMSAAGVLQNLDRNLFEAIPVAIDKNGRWLIDQEANVIFAGQNSLHINYATANELDIMQQSLANKAHLFDVIFPVVHGVSCEDGTLQGLLELLNIPYVGSNVLSSAINMDKDVAKRLVGAAGINIASSLVLRQSQWNSNTAFYRQQIINEIKFPLFVKPCNTGSSVGIKKAHHPDELDQVIEYAFLYDHKIIIETALDVRDVELAVLEDRNFGAPPRVSTAGEIIIAPKHEFYSYEAKYLDPEAIDLNIPAKVSTQLLTKLQTIASEIFTILECEGMARVDLFIEKKTDEVYFNEVNTIPGFTPYSMYPKLWQASGIAYRELLTELIYLALARFERRSKLKKER